MKEKKESEKNGTSYKVHNKMVKNNPNISATTEYYSTMKMNYSYTY